MIKDYIRNLKVDWIDVFKYAAVLAFIVYICVIMSSKGESKVPFRTVAKNVESAADLSALKKADGRTFRKYYGLNEKDYDGVMLYSAKSAMAVDEILVIRLSDTSQAAKAEEAVEERLSSRIKDFEGYGESQTKLLQNAVSLTRGNYVFLAVSPDAQKLQKALKDSL